MQIVEHCFDVVVREVSHFIDELPAPPSALLGGGILALNVALYLYQFAGTWSEPEHRVYSTLQLTYNERDRLGIRIISGINAAGSIARLADWCRSVGWISVHGTLAVSLLCIGHVAGVFHYFNEMTKTIQEINEVERLVDISTRLENVRREDFNPYMWSLWAKYISQLTFFLFSASQLIGLTTAIVVPLTISNTLLIGGLVSLIAFGIIRMSSNSLQLVNECRAHDPHSRYSHIA